MLKSLKIIQDFDFIRFDWRQHCIWYINRTLGDQLNVGVMVVSTFATWPRSRGFKSSKFPGVKESNERIKEVLRNGGQEMQLGNCEKNLNNFFSKNRKFDSLHVNYNHFSISKKIHLPDISKLTMVGNILTIAKRNLT